MSDPQVLVDKLLQLLIKSSPDVNTITEALQYLEIPCSRCAYKAVIDAPELMLLRAKALALDLHIKYKHNPTDTNLAAFQSQFAHVERLILQSGADTKSPKKVKVKKNVKSR